MNSPIVTSRKTIAVFLAAVRSDDRDCLRGLAAYASRQPTWDFQIMERSIYNYDFLPFQRIDAILVRLDEDRSVSHLLPKGLPSVNISGRCEHSPLPRVCNDNEAIGRMAAEHFLSRGYTALANFGVQTHHGLAQRQQAFQDTVENSSSDFRAFEAAESSFPSFNEWVQQMDRPIAVFCCSNSFTRTLVEHCHRHQLQVPEQISILGGTDDELVCNFNTPPLSSIRTNAYRIGHAAGALLSRQMNHEPIEHETRIPPMDVITRRSTDMLAVSDTALISALQFIREYYHRPMSCEEVAEASGISRRSLDRRFAHALGRSVTEEIRRVRIESAKRLLVTTEEPLVKVAELCGFDYPERFSIVFKRIVGTPPSAYRERFRG